MAPNTMWANPKPKTVFAMALLVPSLCLRAYPVAVTAEPNTVGIKPSRMFNGISLHIVVSGCIHTHMYDVRKPRHVCKLRFFIKKLKYENVMFLVLQQILRLQCSGCFHKRPLYTAAFLLRLLDTCFCSHLLDL